MSDEWAAREVVVCIHPRPDPSHDATRDGENDRIDEPRSEQADATAEMESRRGKLLPAGSDVVERHQHPARGSDQAGDRDDQDESLASDLADPGRVLNAKPNASPTLFTGAV